MFFTNSIDCESILNQESVLNQIIAPRIKIESRVVVRFTSLRLKRKLYFSHFIVLYSLQRVNRKTKIKVAKLIVLARF